MTVLADRQYLRQLLTNLLTNAAKYSPDGGAIRIYAVRSSGSARIAVSDRGEGIPPARQAGIFQRFYASRPPGDGGGVGLGLAIARGIVRAHGGAIGLKSAEGVGTTVWFTLPLAEGV